MTTALELSRLRGQNHVQCSLLLPRTDTLSPGPGPHFLQSLSSPFPTSSGKAVDWDEGGSGGLAPHSAGPAQRTPRFLHLVVAR